MNPLKKQPKNLIDLNTYSLAIQAAEEKSSNLKAKNHELQEKLLSLEENIDFIKSENELSIENLESQKQDYSLKIEQLNEALAKNELKLSESINECENLKQQKIELEKTLKAKMKNDSHAQEMQNIIQLKNEDIKKLNDSQNDLLKQFASQQKQRLLANDEIARLQSKMSSLMVDISILEKKSQSSVIHEDDNSKQQTNEESNIAKAFIIGEKIQKKINEILQKTDEAQAKIEQSESNIKHTILQLESSDNNSNGSICAKCVEHVKVIQAKLDEILTLKKKAKYFEDLEIELQEKIESREEEIFEVRTWLSDTEKEMEKKEIELQKLGCKVEELERDKATYEEDMLELQNELKNINEKQMMNESKIKALNSDKERVKDLKSQLSANDAIQNTHNRILQVNTKSLNVKDQSVLDSATTAINTPEIEDVTLPKVFRKKIFILFEKY